MGHGCRSRRCAARGTKPYDHAVDPNTARQVLRISPDTPLTSALIESAYAEESWTRHPSRYPEGRRACAGRGVGDDAGARRARCCCTTSPARPPLRRCPVRGIRRTAPAAAQPDAASRRARSSASSPAPSRSSHSSRFAISGGVRLVTEPPAPSTRRSRPTASDGGPPTSSGSSRARRPSRSRPRSRSTPMVGYNAAVPARLRVGLLADGPLHRVGLRTLEVELGYSSDIDAALPDQTETIQLEGRDRPARDPARVRQRRVRVRLGEPAHLPRLDRLTPRGRALGDRGLAASVARCIVERGRSDRRVESRPEHVDDVDLDARRRSRPASRHPSLTGCVAMPPSHGLDCPRATTPSPSTPPTFTTEIDNPYWPMEPGTRWSYVETRPRWRRARPSTSR